MTPPSQGAPKPPMLLRGWVFFLVVAVAVLCGSAAQIVSRPASYSAQAIISFVPAGDRPISAASVMLMVPRYVEYASSPYVVRQAGLAVGVPAPSLQKGLSVAMPATTANIAVTVATKTPAAAADAANRIAALVLARAVSDPVLAGHLLAAATVPTSPAGPSQTLLMAGAIVAALVLGLLAALAARRYTRRRYPATPKPVLSSNYPPITDERLWARSDQTLRTPAPDAVRAAEVVRRAEKAQRQTAPLADTVEMTTLDDEEDDDTVEFQPAAAEAGRKG